MIDYEELAASIDAMREAFRATVTGLVADGFTDEQARALVVAIFTNRPSEEGEE